MTDWKIRFEIQHPNWGHIFCAITAELKLKRNKGQQSTKHTHIAPRFTTFSAQGVIKGRKYGESGGQCLNQIRDLMNESGVKITGLAEGCTQHAAKQHVQSMVEIWEVWHLNDMVPGCVHQTIGDYYDPAISGQRCTEVPHIDFYAHDKYIGPDTYSERNARRHLKEEGGPWKALFEREWYYDYGHAWLVKVIPFETQALINDTFDMAQQEMSL